MLRASERSSQNGEHQKQQDGSIRVVLGTGEVVNSPRRIGGLLGSHYAKDLGQRRPSRLKERGTMNQTTISGSKIVTKIGLLAADH